MGQSFEMLFTGSGGQGVILASVILAEAAIAAGKQAVQSQSYGPEARGGLCKAETIISDSYITFTEVQKPDFLLALNQKSLEKYAQGLPEKTLILADSSLIKPDAIPEEHFISLPILETAEKKIGKSMTANIVAVGAINALLDLFDDQSLEAGVKLHIPKGTEELNNKALKAGKELVNTKRLSKRAKNHEQNTM